MFYKFIVFVVSCLFSSLVFSAEGSFEAEECRLYKILIEGDYGSGRKSLLHRLTRNEFREQPTKTVGNFVFETKSLSVSNKRIKLQICYDNRTPDGFRYSSINESGKWRGTIAVLLTCDVTKRKSFDHLDRYLKEIEEHTGDALVVLVATKIDYTDRVVSTEELQDYANQKELFFFSTSAKDNIGIEDMFLEVAQSVYDGKRLRKTNCEMLIDDKKSSDSDHNITDEEDQEEMLCQVL